MIEEVSKEDEATPTAVEKVKESEDENVKTDSNEDSISSDEEGPSSKKRMRKLRDKELERRKKCVMTNLTKSFIDKAGASQKQ